MSAATYDDRFPHFPSLLALLLSQGRHQEAWELELRREARIDWELAQAALVAGREEGQ